MRNRSKRLWIVLSVAALSIGAAVLYPRSESDKVRVRVDPGGAEALYVVADDGERRQLTHPLTLAFDPTREWRIEGTLSDGTSLDIPIDLSDDRPTVVRF